MSRCFPTNAPNIYSSDRTRILSQQTIYQNIKGNIKHNITQKTGNKPGSINYCLTQKTSNTNNQSGIVKSVFDYKTLYDISKGNSYCEPCDIKDSNKFTGSNAETSNTSLEVNAKRDNEESNLVCGSVTLKHEDWVNDVKIASSDVISKYASNSYKKKLMKFSLPRRLQFSLV